MSPTYPALDIPEDGKLAHNIAHFARALRKAGLPVGPGRTLDAVHAVAAAGFDRREDFYLHPPGHASSRSPEERQPLRPGLPPLLARSRATSTT
jgi:uncharacterized protein